MDKGRKREISQGGRGLHRLAQKESRWAAQPHAESSGLAAGTSHFCLAVVAILPEVMTTEFRFQQIAERQRAMEREREKSERDR